MRQFFKKAVAVVLTGVLLAGASISAAAAPQELSVTPTVASGEAAVEGDVITLTEARPPRWPSSRLRSLVLLNTSIPWLSRLIPMRLLWT